MAESHGARRISMKKKTVSVLLAAAMALGTLAGCGNSAGTQAPAAEEPAAEQPAAEEPAAEEPAAEEPAAEEPAAETATWEGTL